MTSPHVASPAVRAGVPVLHAVVIVALVALYVWAALGSSGTYDTWRDLFFAERIASGEEFPLSGPGIYRSAHLGPLWFYLLAAALWLWPSAASLPLAMGLIGAAQFPLAYLVGRRVFANPRLGLLFALALLLPGWSAFPVIALTHSGIVGTCMLLGALACWYYRERPGAWRAAWLGLATSLMLHAHPTTLPVACVWVGLALAATPSWRRRGLHLGIIAACAAAPLLPMVVEQWMLGWPDLSSMQAYASSDPAVPTPGRFAALVAGILQYGAEYTTRYWLELPANARRALLLFNAAALLASAAGLVHAWRGGGRARTAIALFATLFVLQCVFVLAIRPVTPFWMIHAHLPILALLVAIGIDAWMSRGVTHVRVWTAVVVVWSLWSAAGLAHIAGSPWKLFVDVPSPGKQSVGLMDIGHLQRHGIHVAVARLPWTDAFAIAGRSCEPVTLYAHYARFADLSFGIGARRTCGTTSHVRLGGIDDANAAWVGLRDYAWREAGITPEHRLGTLGYSKPAVVWHSPRALAIVEPRTYPPRRLVIEPRTFTVAGDMQASQAIVVSFRATGPFVVREALIDGTPATAAYADTSTAVFRPVPGAAAATWSITIEAAPDYVDVVTVDDAAAGR